MEAILSRGCMGVGKLKYDAFMGYKKSCRPKRSGGRYFRLGRRFW